MSAVKLIGRGGKPRSADLVIPTGCTKLDDGRSGYSCVNSGTFAEVPLTLTTTWWSEPVESAANGGQPLQVAHIERVLLGADQLIERTLQTFTPGVDGKPDNEIDRADYGDAFKGFKTFSATIHLRVLSGSIDDRAFVPFSVDKAFDWDQLQFADGNPPPSLDMDPAIKAALAEGMPKLAADPNRAIQILAFGPVSPGGGHAANSPLDWRTANCQSCERDCATDPWSYIIPGKLLECEAECFIPGHGCNQVTCWGKGNDTGCDNGTECCGDLCCDGNSTCGNNDLGYCCPKDHPVACGDMTGAWCWDAGANCCPDGSTFACPSGQACQLAGPSRTPTCCAMDKVCGDSCCGANETCQTDGNGKPFCCGGTMCGGQCCDNGATCNNGKCGFGQVCGNDFCGLGSQCCNGSCCNGTCVGGKTCCPNNRASCGNACCNEGDSCIAGKCTSPAAASTILYRPDNTIVSTSAGQIGTIFGGNKATLKGTSFPAGTVTVWTGGKTFGSTSVGSDGKFSFVVDSAGLAAGRYTIVATRGSRNVTLNVDISIPH
jgi:hypothetical protein